jgi:hypothetical protein
LPPGESIDHDRLHGGVHRRSDEPALSDVNNKSPGMRMPVSSTMAIRAACLPTPRVSAKGRLQGRGRDAALRAGLDARRHPACALGLQRERPGREEVTSQGL